MTNDPQVEFVPLDRSRFDWRTVDFAIFRTRVRAEVVITAFRSRQGPARAERRWAAQVDLDLSRDTSTKVHNRQKRLVRTLTVSITIGDLGIDTVNSIGN